MVKLLVVYQEKELKMNRVRNKFKRVVSSKVFEDMSLTEQSKKEEANINNIVGKYKRTGILPIARGRPQYGDFTNVSDYQSSLQKIIEVNEEFENLPAVLRKKFKNDPSNMLEFVMDENNREEAEKLGLLEVVEEVVKPLTKDDLKESLQEIEQKKESEKDDVHH